MGHYLDDFVLVGPPGSRDCGRFLQVALRVCKDSGFPVAEEKNSRANNTNPSAGYRAGFRAAGAQTTPWETDKVV